MQLSGHGSIPGDSLGRLTRGASFDVARFVVLAPKGPDKTAQGNALGTRNTAENERKSPEGAQQPTGDVAPLQGSVEGFATATPGVARGCFVAAPSGRRKFIATPKLALRVSVIARRSPRGVTQTGLRLNHATVHDCVCPGQLHGHHQGWRLERDAGFASRELGI